LRGFDRAEIDLLPDGEGIVRVSVVRKVAEFASKVAVLYVHGFSDYFWNVRPVI